MTIVRTKLYCPTLWTCPRCNTRVRTHVDTYPVECRHKSHQRDTVLMNPESEEVSDAN
jgi:primosomal protein N'